MMIDVNDVYQVHKVNEVSQVQRSNDSRIPIVLEWDCSEVNEVGK